LVTKVFSLANYTTTVAPTAYIRSQVSGASRVPELATNKVLLPQLISLGSSTIPSAARSQLVLLQSAQG
jgi:hypothetical protein